MSKFTPYITYIDETVFSTYDGIIIARCTNCKILKTIPPKKSKVFDPKTSRFQMYEHNRRKFIELFNPLAKIILRYKQSGKVLDVGCSTGIFMEVLKKIGFSVYGIEPNKNAYAIAKQKFGDDVFNGTLKDFRGKNSKHFDIVIYNHVLEHIEHINEEIKLAKSYLAPHGLLIIAVPNTRNIIFRLRHKYWEPLMPGEHIWHFSDFYLARLVRKFNFALIDTYYFNDKRSDYPVLKRVYFSILSFVNKIFNTGESMLMIVQKQ